jgi:hypothetical protein
VAAPRDPRTSTPTTWSDRAKSRRTTPASRVDVQRHHDALDRHDDRGQRHRGPYMIVPVPRRQRFGDPLGRGSVEQGTPQGTSRKPQQYGEPCGQEP